MPRQTLALVVLSALAATAAVAGPATRAPSADLTGMWVLSTGEQSVVHVEDLSLTPLGKARMDARTAEVKKGLVRSEGHVRCEPAGMPQMMTAPFGIQILQGKDRILLAAEVSNLPRTLYFRKDHPDDIDPSWNGHSIARWEGQGAHRTLVVDTVGFNDADAFDFNFDPPVKRTASLHIVERMHLEDGGKALVDDMTLIDPTTFAKPAQVRYRYRKLPARTGLMEYVCEVDVPSIQAFDAEHKDRKPAYNHPY